MDHTGYNGNKTIAITAIYMEILPSWEGLNHHI
jgi:hypothetical protein